MGETLIVIQQGAPTIVEEPITFLGTGSAGDPDACRRLVFPAGVSPLLAPIVYQVTDLGICLNPTRTFNLDNTVLPHPVTNPVKTIGSTRVVRFDQETEDVIVTEQWDVDGGSSMPTFFLRLLYEYLINQPPFDPSQIDFITWEPRDRSDRIYSVDLLSLSVGGGTGETQFDIRDIRGKGGDEVAKGTDFLNTLPTGLVDQEVSLRMRIIADVTP